MRDFNAPISSSGETPTYEGLLKHFNGRYYAQCPNEDCEVDHFQISTKQSVPCPNPECGFVCPVTEGRTFQSWVSPSRRTDETMEQDDHLDKPIK